MLSSVDLRGDYEQVYSQGSESSCGPHAMTAALDCMFERSTGKEHRFDKAHLWRWDVIDMPTVNAEEALARFAERNGLGYDWPGALRWGLPFLRQRPRADYCFELVAYMLGLTDPSRWSPLDLRDLFLEF